MTQVNVLHLIRKSMILHNWFINVFSFDHMISVMPGVEVFMLFQSLICVLKAQTFLVCLFSGVTWRLLLEDGGVYCSNG